jgi:sigma-B regulation protein RsbU (phosphoserine phosphatase)
MLNAGHLPPLVVRNDGLEELDHGDPAIGIMNTAAYREREVRLEAGELMIVYSDGLTEARNGIGRFFGEDRLRELADRLRGFTAEQAGDVLLRAVERFEQGARRHDDLSIIIIRRLKENSSAVDPV